MLDKRKHIPVDGEYVHSRLEERNELSTPSIYAPDCIMNLTVCSLSSSGVVSFSRPLPPVIATRLLLARASRTSRGTFPAQRRWTKSPGPTRGNLAATWTATRTTTRSIFQGADHRILGRGGYLAGNTEYAGAWARQLFRDLATTTTTVSCIPATQSVV